MVNVERLFPVRAPEADPESIFSAVAGTRELVRRRTVAPGTDTVESSSRPITAARNARPRPGLVHSLVILHRFIVCFSFPYAGKHQIEGSPSFKKVCPRSTPANLLATASPTFARPRLVPLLLHPGIHSKCKGEPCASRVRSEQKQFSGKILCPACTGSQRGRPGPWRTINSRLTRIQGQIKSGFQGVSGRAGGCPQAVASDR